MHIKTQDGEAHVTPQGQGNLNTVLGAVGTAGALGMFNGIGLFGGNRPPMSDGDKPVTRYELGLIRESMAKDGEIASLKANMYTNDAVNGVRQQLNDFIQQQSVYNGVNNSAIQCLQNQISQLQGMTRMVIPNSNIAPGWGPFPEPVIVSQSTTAQNTGSNTQQG